VPELNPDDLRAQLLSAYRTETPGPDASVDNWPRVVDKVHARVPASDAPALEGRWWALAAAVAVAAALVLVWRFFGGTVAPERTRDRPSQAVDRVRTPADREAHERTPETKMVPSQVLERESTADDEPRPRSRPAQKRSRPDPSAATEDALAEETRLLTRTRSAVRGGDFEAAIALLDEHQRRHPDGVLAPERRAYRIVVRCRTDAPGARSAAASFAAEHRDSPLRGVVQEACGGE
jgi:hypothetical protein